MTIDALHEWAMDEAANAMVLRHKGRADEAKRIDERAAYLERQAADLIAPHIDREPNRSVLHRSAAWLALQAGLPGAARQVAQRGLDGSPPAEIEAELRDVLAVAEETLRAAGLAGG